MSESSEEHVSLNRGSTVELHLNDDQILTWMKAVSLRISMAGTKPTIKRAFEVHSESKVLPTAEDIRFLDHLLDDAGLPHNTLTTVRTLLHTTLAAVEHTMIDESM